MYSKDGFMGKGKNSNARKFISVCALFLLGSAYALAGYASTETGEIVMNHVGASGKIVTMLGEVKGDKVNGFNFVVPGKKFDVKCTFYQISAENLGLQCA
jgi:hypothetical protein